MSALEQGLSARNTIGAIKVSDPIDQLIEAAESVNYRRFLKKVTK